MSTCELRYLLFRMVFPTVRTLGATAKEFRSRIWKVIYKLCIRESLEEWIITAIKNESNDEAYLKLSNSGFGSHFEAMDPAIQRADKYLHVCQAELLKTGTMLFSYTYSE